MCHSQKTRITGVALKLVSLLEGPDRVAVVSTLERAFAGFKLFGELWSHRRPRLGYSCFPDPCPAASDCNERKTTIHGAPRNDKLPTPGGDGHGVADKCYQHLLFLCTQEFNQRPVKFLRCFLVRQVPNAFKCDQPAIAEILT